MLRFAQQVPSPQPSRTPILGEQSLMLMTVGVLALMAVAAICIAVILIKNPAGMRDVTSGNTLHIVTVMLVIFPTSMLALEGILSGEVVASLFSGIVGYVLGSLRTGLSRTGNNPPRGAQPPTTSGPATD